MITVAKCGNQLKYIRIGRTRVGNNTYRYRIKSSIVAPASNCSKETMRDICLVEFYRMRDLGKVCMFVTARPRATPTTLSPSTSWLPVTDCIMRFTWTICSRA